MVLRVDHLGESHFTSDAALIDTSNSTPLDRVDCPQIDDVPVFLWRAPTGAPWDPITYWIGAEGLVVAFATVRPFASGAITGLEAIRAWSSPGLRATGLVRLLLVAASEGRPLISDREGMTPVAYAGMTKVQGVRRYWLDAVHDKLCDESEVPEGERFSTSPAAKRWCLVLEFV